MFNLNLNYKILYNIMARIPLVITGQAWNKMIEVLKKTKKEAFLFSAIGGGCNGFNYDLKTIDKKELEKITDKKFIPPVYQREKYKLVVDPMSEILLTGTTIDYINEDYSKHIFESKFTFTPTKSIASTCGCGVSFSPK